MTVQFLVYFVSILENFRDFNSILELLQALDKSQLGDVVRQKEQKLDTPGKQLS